MCISTSPDDTCTKYLVNDLPEYVCRNCNPGVGGWNEPQGRMTPIPGVMFGSARAKQDQDCLSEFRLLHSLLKLLQYKAKAIYVNDGMN